ncbi:NAD(+) kinase [Ascosphaera pollenicola]|nr:NAD(+) kinase [Ascosphaera pollenicola]
MVLSDSVSLKIAVPMHSRSTAYCSFDGKSRTELRQGDYVTVEASQFPFPTVVSGHGEWFDSVRRALRWNNRGAVQRGWGANHNEDQMDPVDVNLGGMGCEDNEEKQGQWDIDTDSNEDIMHYETMPFSARRSPLLSQSADNPNSVSNSETPPEGTVYSESSNSTRNVTGASSAVKGHDHDTTPAKTCQNGPDDELKFSSLSISDGADSDCSPRASLDEQLDKVEKH